jgi:hypothetical protein
MTVGLYNHDDKWTTELVYLSAAFFEGKIDDDKPVFIQIPDRVVELALMSAEEAERSCYQLERSMYGNLDAATSFLQRVQQPLDKSDEDATMPL